MKGVVLIVGILVLEAAFLFHAALPVNAGLLRPAYRPASARQAQQPAPARPESVALRAG